MIKKRKDSGKYFLEWEILDYMIDICEGVLYCHLHNIVHKDLKPQNILSINGRLKLCDFGIARVLENTEHNLKTKNLTWAYAAPELMANKEFRFKVDIWALGCILYELCALKKPFYPQYQAGEYNEAPLQKYSHELKTLISELLYIKPEFRPSINIVTGRVP